MSTITQSIKTALSRLTLQARTDVCLRASRAFGVTANVRHETPKDGGACNKSAATNPVKTKTPIGRLDEIPEGRHPYQEKEPLPEFPDGVNPQTGEVGGPKGPEPTRYGDWERKGRVTDF